MRYELSHVAIEKSYEALVNQISHIKETNDILKGQRDSLSEKIGKERTYKYFKSMLNDVRILNDQIAANIKLLEELDPVLDEMYRLYDMDRIKNFYFVFGEGTGYPFKADEYVVVRARNFSEAGNTFKRFYPNYDDPFTLNCADYYSERLWDIQESRRFKVCGEVKPPAVILDFTDSDENMQYLKGESYDKN